jgi:hypothetical protein
MAKPQKPHVDKKDVHHCYKVDVPQCFYLKGTDLGKAKSVRLVESGDYVWDPPEVPEAALTKTATTLRFVSTPRHRSPTKKPKRPAGTLTITVTNPEGDDQRAPTVYSWYE